MWNDFSSGVGRDVCISGHCATTTRRRRLGAADQPVWGLLALLAVGLATTFLVRVGGEPLVFVVVPRSKHWWTGCMARRVPFVQGMELADCGAACLSMVLANHGKPCHSRKCAM
jgi:hypothetical protein